MSSAAVQKHVAVLERAHLVTRQRRGREQVVRCNIDTIRTAGRLFDQFEAMWRNRMDRFDEVLAEPDRRSQRMTVTNVHKDPETMAMTITSEFDAPIGRVWQLWEDPRQLERWWGPPTYPSTFVDHGLTPGGLVTYFMTGPDGDQPRGWWRVLAIDAPYHLEFEDGFSDDAGNPNPDMPTMIIRVDLSEQPNGGTRMAVETTFPSLAVMEQMVTMGMEEGMTAAIGQIDELLRAGSAPSR